MKKTHAPLIALLLTVSTFAKAEKKEGTPAAQTVTLKTHLLPGFLYFVKGDITLTSDSLRFMSATECFDWKLLGKIYPCHNDLFRAVQVPLSSIAKVSRRNTLLIFPNKFVVRLKDGRKYKFFSYKRGRILRALKQNPQYGA
ncbi:hypothetical protein [Spirosoma montaniterrae]|nr:hypothetical protein [Spirosoma montaniterrae]